VPAALKQAGGLGERHVGALISLTIAGPATVSELAETMDMSLAHAGLVVGDLAERFVDQLSRLVECLRDNTHET
jgi:hypothetical protein